MSKRSYMSAEKRREHLLDTAARILADDGWMGLTMQAVAREGGTSRQLVYEYFPSLKSMTVGLLRHLLGDLEDKTEEIFADQLATASQLVRRSVEPLFELDDAQSAALSAVLVDQKFTDPDLNVLMQNMREMVIDRWLRIYEVQSGEAIPKETLNLARAVLLARLSGSWALIGEAKLGKITNDQAMKVIETMSKRTHDLFN